MLNYVNTKEDNMSMLKKAQAFHKNKAKTMANKGVAPSKPTGLAKTAGSMLMVGAKAAPVAKRRVEADSNPINYNFVGSCAAYVRNVINVPADSLAIATTLFENQDLWDDFPGLVEAMSYQIEECVVRTSGGAYPVSYDTNQLEELLEAGLFVDGEPSPKLLEMISDAKKIKQDEFFTRIDDYGIGEKHTSPMARKAVHHSEQTLWKKNDEAYDIALQVLDTLPVNHKLHSDDYAMEAIGHLTCSVRLERKLDKGGRIYQVLWHGLQPNESDLMRSICEYADIDMGYDPQVALELYLAKIKDLCPDVTDEMLLEAASDPVNWIIKTLEDGSVAKPFWFRAYAKGFVDLYKHIHEGGDKPFLGLPVGIDATCSGLQLAGCILGDEKILQRCGFSYEDLQDSYDEACRVCETKGIFGFTRALMKGPFIAILYSQGKSAYKVELKDAEKCKEAYMNPEIWNLIHNEGEMDEFRAELFHDSVVKSFGKKVDNLRVAMSNTFGSYWDEELESFQPKNEVPIWFKMQDGLEVRKKHMRYVNILGEENGGLDFTLDCGLDFTYSWKKATYATKEYNLSKYGANGFVTLIHALDALVCRAVICKLADKGVHNVLTNHDCFSVDINNYHHLEDAIKEVYIDLFSGHQDPMGNPDYPAGLDVIKNYFDAAVEAMLPEFKKKYEDGHGKAQFFKNKQGVWIRRAFQTNKIAFKELVEGLAPMDGGTTYFK